MGGGRPFFIERFSALYGPAAPRLGRHFVPGGFIQPAPSASSVCGRDLCCFALGFVAAILVISILPWPDVHVDQL